MSSALYVRQTPTEPEGIRLSFELKQALEKRGLMNDWDGLGIDRTYIEALDDAGIPGADALLEFYDQCHGRVEFRRGY